MLFLVNHLESTPGFEVVTKQGNAWISKKLAHICSGIISENHITQLKAMKFA